MIKKVIEIDVKTASAVKNVDNLNESIKETGEVGHDSMDGLATATGGLSSKFTGLTKGLGSVIKSFKSLRVAVMASGIGLLVVGVLALKQAFTRSEEGQNKFSTMMAVIGVVTDKLLDSFADLGDKIMSVFENPKQALEDFWTALKENVVNRIEGLLELIPALGTAINQVFEGDFSGAAETSANALAKVVLGVEDIVAKTVEAGKKFGEYVDEVVEGTEKITIVTQKRNQADKLQRKLTIDRAKADRKIADLREKAADRENYTALQRIGYLQDAGKISEDITNKEIHRAKLLYDAKKLENAQSKSTKEDKQELADLEAAMINLETQRISKQKALTAAVQTAIAEQKALTDQKIKEDEATQKKIDADKTKKDAKDISDAKIKQAKIDADAEKSRIKNAELDRLVYQAKIGMSIQGLNILADVLGKETAAGKAAAIASTTIDTYASATAAYKSVVGLGPAGPVLAPIAAGIAVASGLANVHKILSVKTPTLQGSNGGAPSGGGRGGGVASIPIPQAPDAPSFGDIGSNSGNAIAGLLGENNDKPIKAYVVGKEVTTQQSLDRELNRNVSF